jgi:hypothetical protein
MKQTVQQYLPGVTQVTGIIALLWLLTEQDNQFLIGARNGLLSLICTWYAHFAYEYSRGEMIRQRWAFDGFTHGALMTVIGAFFAMGISVIGFDWITPKYFAWLVVWFGVPACMGAFAGWKARTDGQPTPKVSQTS